MNLSSLLFLVFFLALAAWYFGQQRALLFRQQTQLHSQPRYHGAYVALWCGLPALLVLLLWSAMGPGVIDSILAQEFSGESGNISSSDIGLMLNEVKNLASQGQLTAAEPDVRELAHQYLGLQSSSRLYQALLVVIIALAGGFWASSRLSAEYRTRNAVEKTVRYLLMGASIIAILITVGIVMSVLFESIRFFKSVPISEFLFGLHWSPQTAIRTDQVAASGSFGAIPLLAGTFLISFIALCVAIPFGLMSAIYLSEYATPRFRGLAKPMLEILAGVPTVVYGFFAALTVGPFIRLMGETIGLNPASESALAAGLVMGVMIIPFISSLSDDAINAVPQSMRDGSYGLGATQSETIGQVIIPAALPGIAGGILLAASRAMGETMIVVMAAGLTANLTANPLQSVTTVTVQIVTLLTGDQEFDSPKTLSAFALGLLLFVITLLLNLIALHVVRKYREQYE